MLLFGDSPQLANPQYAYPDYAVVGSTAPTQTGTPVYGVNGSTGSSRRRGIGYYHDGAITKQSAERAPAPPEIAPYNDDEDVMLIIHAFLTTQQNG